jgi:3D (Asp-Asp-Asp) domain-containing protein
MAHRPSAAIGSACLTGVALLVFTASAANSQDDAGKSKQTEKKKAEARKLEVKVKVSAADGKPLPAGSMVEISGQETACGSLNSNDARATVDDKGEAVFPELPACKVTVKMNLNRYLPARKVVDLTGYKSCAAATGPAATACEAVSLVLEPL